jgi:hypothetical protein
MTLSGEHGSRLADLAGRSEVTIQLKGTAVSPYACELLNYQAGISMSSASPAAVTSLLFGLRFPPMGISELAPMDGDRLPGPAR